MMAAVALRTVLLVLALYHLVIGVVSVLSFRATTRLTSAFYGLSVRDDPQLAYAVRMLGLYALAVGSLLVFAAREPTTHRDVIAVVAGLQLLRAASRIVSGRELESAFALPPRRNAINAALLVVEAAILVLCFPAA